MPLDTLRAEITAELVQHLDARPDRVTPDARLFHDLGMDGDDAVEFFRWFAGRYDVDLRPLYDRWPEHFGPEGFGSAWLALVPAWVVLLLITARLDLNPFIPLVALPAFAAILAWRAVRYLRRPPPRPITVDDLVAAAATHRWPEPRAPEPVRRRP